MKKQRILSILLSLAMIVSMLPSALAMDVKTFKDVDANAWYYTFVKEVVEDDFFHGTSETEFSPNTVMTRAMFVQSLYKVATKNIGELNPANSSSFADVSADAWYAKAVAWAKEARITEGVSEDQFGPDLAIQRQEIAVMMEKFVEYLCEQTSTSKQTVDQKDNTKKTSFDDASAIADWAKAAVEQCRVWGLVAGYPDGEFKPLNEGTRAEIATIIANLDLFVEKISKPEPTEPSEDPTEPSEEPTEPSEDPTEPTTEEPTTEEPTTEEPTTEEPTTEEPTTEEPTTEEPTTDPSEPVDYIYNALAGIISDVKADVKENGKLVLNATELDEKALNYIKNNKKLMAAAGLAVDAAQAVGTVGNGFVAIGGSESYIALTGVTLGGPNAVGSTEHPIDVTYVVDMNTNSFVNLINTTYSVAVENAVALASFAAGLDFSIDKQAAKEVALEIAEAVAAKVKALTEVEIPVETIKAAAEKAVDAAIYGKHYADSYVKNLWVDNFKGENGYYTGDVKFIVNNTVVTVKVDNQTSLVGSKKDAVVDLAVAIAKDLCYDLTSLKDWTSFTEIDPSVTVEVLFSAGAYAEDTDNFPYSYPVSFTLDVEGTIADNLEWKFNRGPFVKFIITERMQNAYDAMVKKATNPALLNLLASNIGNNNVFNAVMGNVVDAAIEEAMSPMGDAMASVGVQPGGEAAVELAKPENEDTLRELIQMYAPEQYKQAVAMGMDDYAIAKVQDFLMTAPGSEKVTVNSDAARPEMETTVGNLMSGGTSSLFENPMLVNYLKKVPTLVEKLKLAQLATFDKVAELKLGNLATAMRTETFQNFIDRGERVDNIVDRVLDLIKFIPDEASVIINGKTINEKTLAAVRDAEGTVEACNAVADLIDVIGDATLSTFDGDGVKVTVKYNDKFVNFGLALDI